MALSALSRVGIQPVTVEFPVKGANWDDGSFVIYLKITFERNIQWQMELEALTPKSFQPGVS